MGTGMMTTVEQADMAIDMTDMMTETGAMTDMKTEGMIDMMTTVVVRQHLLTSAFFDTSATASHLAQTLQCPGLFYVWLIDGLDMFHAGSRY